MLLDPGEKRLVVVSLPVCLLVIGLEKKNRIVSAAKLHTICMTCAMENYQWYLIDAYIDGGAPPLNSRLIHTMMGRQVSFAFKDELAFNTKELSQISEQSNNNDRPCAL